MPALQIPTATTSVARTPIPEPVAGARRGGQPVAGRTHPKPEAGRHMPKPEAGRHVPKPVAGLRARGSAC